MNQIQQQQAPQLYRNQLTDILSFETMTLLMYHLRNINKRTRDIMVNELRNRRPILRIDTLKMGNKSPLEIDERLKKFKEVIGSVEAKFWVINE